MTSTRAPAATADDIKAAVITIESSTGFTQPLAPVTGAEILASHVVRNHSLLLASKEPSWILAQFLRFKNAARKSSPLQTSAISKGPRREDTEPKTILAAAADPNYQLWQSKANEKLETENKLTNRKEHPAAAAHPESFVVVCEAGCRDKIGTIVYMVPKAAAAALPKGALEPSASSPDNSQLNSPITQPAADADPLSLPCVAGCYDRPAPRSPAVTKKAETAVPATVMTRIIEEKVTGTAHHAAVLGAEVAPNSAAVRSLRGHALRSVKDAKRGWRATIIRRSATETNGPVTNSHKRSAKEKIRHVTEHALRHRKFAKIVLDALR